MKRNSKEFEELRQDFERVINKMPIYIGAKIERENKNSSHYYCNGNVNNLFIAFMGGYQHAKALARIDALELNE